MKLVSSAGNDKVKLIPACCIFHAALEKPRFVALSYVWGDATNSRVILVNSLPFLLTKNLYDAMMALRSDREHQLASH